MAQVAHASSYHHFAAGPMSPSFEMPSSPASALVQLPRKLARPQFTEVSRSAIARAHPELAEVPLEYVRNGLRAQANQMLSASKAVAPHISSSAARAPAVALPPVGPSAPTHVLAVSSSSKSAPSPTAMIPSHHLVLLASCALLPALPASRPGAPTPVVPLSLPSAETFSLLHTYLYTHATPQLLSALLGLQLPPSALAGPSDARRGGSQLVGQLAHGLVGAAAGDLARLMSIAKRINGVWKNACALGVYDLELWDGLDLAWDAVLGAMNLVVRN